MELGRLIKLNFQGDCFYQRKNSSNDSHLDRYVNNLSKKDEKYLGEALKILFGFRSDRSFQSFCSVNSVGFDIAWALTRAFVCCLVSSKMQLIFTSTEINKMSKEEYESLLKKADDIFSIRFCKIKVSGSPDFDCLLAFVKDEGDFPKAITEYFKKLQEKHPRKYKNLKYRIQFTGKI